MEKIIIDLPDKNSWYDWLASNLTGGRLGMDYKTHSSSEIKRIKKFFKKRKLFLEDVGNLID